MAGFGFGGTNGSNIRPRVIYDAKAGKLFRADRVEDNDGWKTQRTELKPGSPEAAFAVNIGSAVFGWVDFSQMPPKELLVPFTEGAAPPPRPAWHQPRPSVELQIKLSKTAAAPDRQEGDYRQLASSALCVIAALGELKDTIVGAPEHDAGQVPVVSFADTKEQRTKHGTNWVPVLEVVKWIDPPEGFEDATAFARGSAEPMGETAKQQAERDIDFLDHDPLAGQQRAVEAVEEF